MANNHHVTDMVPVRGDEFPTQLEVGEVAEAHLEAMRWREEIIAQRVPAILKHTSPRHWVDYGGESDPRPEDEAAVIFATMLGVSYRWLAQEDGRNYSEHPIQGKPGTYEIIMEIEGSAFGRSAQDMGSCRSDDGLLSKSKRQATPGHALWSDVKKKAMANAIVRLLLALGMRGITWEDLDRAGIKRAECHRVEFAEGEAAAGKRAVREQVSKPCPKCATEPCEKCKESGKGGLLSLRLGTRGQFLGCSHYPACRHTQEVSAEEPATEPEATGEATTESPSDVATRIEASLERAIPLKSERVKWLHDQFNVNTTHELDPEQAVKAIEALEEMTAKAAA